MATTCVTQMPVPPMATDATSSHRELIDLKPHHRAALTETFAPTPDSAHAGADTERIRLITQVLK